jgi:hypothetical protein
MAQLAVGRILASNVVVGFGFSLLDVTTNGRRVGARARAIWYF